MTMDLLDIEPDENPSRPIDGVVVSEPEQPAMLELATVLPQNFPLLTLLRFLPDVKLKQRVAAAAAAALAVDVRADGGLAAADAALPELRSAIADATVSFDEPVSLANQLHKRLTGLRGDFTKDGAAAIETVNERIRVEKRRRDAIDAAANRIAQDAADKLAREVAAKAAKDAAARKAPKDVVAALKEQAKTATAPPVSVPASAPALKNTTVVEKWKCRLKGTPDGDEPNPEMDKLSLSQQQQVRRIFKAIGEGWMPLVAASLDWSYLNAQAVAQKTTFDMTELEAFDEGGTRSKPGRKK